MVAVYVIAGTFMDLGVNLIILVPVLFPITGLQGIDPVHIGVITVMVLPFGLVTLPGGAYPFGAFAIAKYPMFDATNPPPRSRRRPGRRGRQPVTALDEGGTPAWKR